MLQLIKKLLKQIIDDIDAGNSNISYEEQCKILHFIQNMTDKGYKQDGFKELSWMKSDLDFYLDTYSNNK